MEDEEDAEDEVFSSIEEGKLTFPEDIRISKEAKDLILKLLEADPQKRLPADKALNHPWMRKETPTNSTSENTEPSGSKNKLTASAVFNTNDKNSLKMSINKAIDSQKDPKEIKEHAEQHNQNQDSKHI